jgi:hypothetical protein
VQSNDQSGHVLWIVADPPPLPRKVKWKSTQIEQVVRSSQEVLLPPVVKVSPDEKIGLFRGLSLLPLAIGWRRNPGEATLMDVLPPELYARWRSEKSKYLRGKDRIERWRPIFAAKELRRKAFAKQRLREGGLVAEVVLAIAAKTDIAVTEPALRVTFPTKDIKNTFRRFMSEPLDDAECMASTLDLVSAISEKATMNARASAWATGDVATLSDIPALPDPNVPCNRALLSSSVARESIPRDIEGQSDALWLEQAERSLAQNVSTFAILPLPQLTAANGYLAKLHSKGYLIEEPERVN